MFFFNIVLLRQLLTVTTNVSFVQSFVITSVTHSYHRCVCSIFCNNVSYSQLPLIFLLFNLCNYVSYP